MSCIEKFVYACELKNVEEVKGQIAEGVDINARSSDGLSGLSVAMHDNQVSTVKVLLACSNIRLDSTDYRSGWTGLHYACFLNTVESIDLFLAHPGCTKQIVRMKDRNGYTAQMLANKMGSFRRIKEFLEKTDNVWTGNDGLGND